MWGPSFAAVKTGLPCSFMFVGRQISKLKCRFPATAPPTMSGNIKRTPHAVYALVGVQFDEIFVLTRFIDKILWRR